MPKPPMVCYTRTKNLRDILVRAKVTPSRYRQGRRQARTGVRKVTWFNPPFCKSIKTKLGAEFLKLIDMCFPKTHPLNKVINRNTVKATYCTMTNMKQIIGKHNAKLLNEKNKSNTPLCNCRVRDLRLPLCSEVD